MEGGRGRDGERERGGRGGGDVDDVAPDINLSKYFQLDFSMPNKF